MSKLKAYVRPLIPVVDVLYLPLAVVVGLLAKPYSRLAQHMKWSRNVLDRFGLSIIRHHYYGPIVLPANIRRNLSEDRGLAFIDLAIGEQLALLSNMNFTEELSGLADQEINGVRFDIGNRNFGPGDFDIYYSVIRYVKPRRIVEIGAGHSTVVASVAARRNGLDGTQTEITCIEPFEMPWLPQLGVTVLRAKVEEVAAALFESLSLGDILFIDSSHVIRPQGDVLYEFFSLLPRLQPGVIVHLHDIFTPFDYPAKWVIEERRLWNEQYLLEAFLAYNSNFQVMLANNFLKHAHFDALKSVCPHLTPAAEPGSFWLRRRK